MDTETMEKKLYDACLNGDVETLEAIMKEDKLILARVSLSSSFNKQTPLHLACMLGHFEFAKSILSYKPDIACSVDSEGHSPLHLACANGYVNIVQLLLDHKPKMCQVRDEDGRTPLHLAVMNGRQECITELIKVNSDQEGTVLHLCVKYNRLNVLMPMLDQSNDKDLSNKKDGEGNTILHSAAALGRTKIVKYLVTRSEVNLNLLNKKGLTPLAIIEEQMPNKDTKTMEIKDTLVSAAIERAQKINPQIGKVADDNILGEALKPVIKMWKKMKNFTIFQDKPGDRDESLLIAATVIAAMAYQAAISPPGGVASVDAALNSDANFTSDSDAYKLKPGASLVAYFYSSLSDTFWMSNTISFMAALIVIFLFVAGATLKRRLFVWLVRAAMWVTLTSMTVTYVCAVLAINPNDVKEKTVFALIFGLSAWVVLIIISILVVAFRSIRYLMSIIPKKEESRWKLMRNIRRSTAEAFSTSTAPNSNNMV